MRYIKESFILFLLLTVVSIGNAQLDFSALEAESGSATMDQNFCLTLDNTSVLSDYYMIDISGLGFINSSAASKKFNTISNNLVTYIPDFINSRAFVRIHNDRIPDGETGNVTWWNNYLANLCNLQ